MSRVLIAGGTGVLGRAATPALQAAGHEVVTSSRRAEGLPGVRHVPADWLDAEAAGRAVAETAPDVVVHALTALPPGGPRRKSDLELTDRLRTEGTDNLVAACRAHGVERIVGQSFVLALPAVRHLEQAVTAAGGVVLRFGLFYGPGSRVSEEQAEALRRRRLPLPGGAPSVFSYVHMEDAGRAVAVAVDHGEPGTVYDVGDDEPVAVGTFLTAFAEAIGAPRPRRVPLWPVKLLMPYAASFLAGTHAALDNTRLKALGWAPRYPTYREGLASGG